MNGSGNAGLKQAAVVLGIVLLGVLAVVVARQISAEAMAVTVGIVCGVGAAIPTSLLLLVVLTRSERRRMDEEERGRGLSSQGQYPPVVVIQSDRSWGMAPAGDTWLHQGRPLPAPRLVGTDTETPYLESGTRR